MWTEGVVKRRRCIGSAIIGRVPGVALQYWEGLYRNDSLTSESGRRRV